jgi:hypothetical protein
MTKAALKKIKCLVQRNIQTKVTTVVLDTKHYKEKDPDAELYKAAQAFRVERTVATYEYLIGMVAPELEKVKEMVATVFVGDDFEIRGDKMYLKGSKIPLPPVMRRKVEHFIAEGYPVESLVNFWSLCLLNPSAQARDGFFTYCEKYNVTVTDGGYAVMYKTVTHKRKARYRTDLADFVAEAAMKVKTSRKSRKLYNVYLEDDIHQLHSAKRKTKPAGKKVGNLDELFLKIDKLAEQSQTVYTDKHTRQSNIVLGKPEKKDRRLCDPNINVACGKGLHVGSHSYVKAFADIDDTILAILVNPMHIVALPASDDSKIRCCEYFPYAIMTRRGPNGDWDEVPSEYFEEHFRNYEKKDIGKLLLTGGQSDIEISPKITDLYGDS